jgi:hypothetical protein
MNEHYSLDESTFVQSPEKVMPYPNPLESQQVNPERVLKP